MADKQTGVRLQAILDQVENVRFSIMFEDTHTLIKHCFQLFELHQLVSTSPSIANLPADIQDMLKLERKYTDTAVQGVVGQLTLLEHAIDQSNKNVAGNQQQLQNSFQGLRQAVNDITTHYGHQSQIIDTIKNQVDGNSKEATMLRELLKDHTATKHHTQPDPVVYAWDVQPYELNIRTKTSVPAAGHTYEYKYTLNGVETSIVKSDANLAVGVELGTLTYTPLNSGVSKVVIERTS